MSRRIGIASLIWSLSILLSRIVGLVREAALGRILGGGADADLWRTAFIIPDFLNYLLAGGALSIAFIPLFADYLRRNDEAEGWRAFSVIANVLLLVVGLGVAVLYFAAPRLTELIVPGFGPAQRAALVSVTRIVLFAQIFHIVGALLSATLQARDKHALPALAPLLYNVGIVVGGVLGESRMGPYGFAWGVLIGSIIGPFGLPMIGVLRTSFCWYPTLSLRHPALRTYLVRSAPIMLGWSIVVVDDWILRSQGSLLGEGAIATLGYAKALMLVPMGVFGLATGVAAYPTLDRLVATGQRAEAYRTLSSAVRRMLVLACAAQVALTVAGPEIARVIYGGKIAAAQHEAIGQALAIFSVALWAWASNAVVSRGFYATGNTWLPTLIGTLLVPLLYPLYVILRGAYGINGLALASTTAATIYMLILILAVRRKFATSDDEFGRFFLRLGPAIVAGIGCAWAARHFGSALLASLPALPRGAILVAIGVGIYVALIVLFRLREFKELVGVLRRRGRP